MKKNLDTASEADTTQSEELEILSPDMAVFPNSDAVNEALRTLVKAAQQSVPRDAEREAA